MKKKLRFLSLLLAFVLFGSSFTAVPAYAAPSAAGKAAVYELSGLGITDLEEPEAGKKLDDKATVRSSEGVTWEIPVLWTDDTGKAAVMAEAGKKYLPTFVFYVPAGYRLKGLGTDGVFSVNLPGFVANLKNSADMIYAADSSAGITYLTWNIPNKNPAAAVSPTGTAVNQGSGNTDSGSESSDNNASDSNDSEDDSDDDSEDQYWEARIHCGKNTLEKYGAENLAWLVNLIKHELEPRAIAALTEGFPAFKKASENNELSLQTGLYVYDVSLDKDADDVRNTTDAVAYVQHGYDDKTGLWRCLVGVNIDGMLVLKDGKYVLKDGKETELENTLVHELMHALMGDYTRTGMGSSDWPYQAGPGYSANPNPTGKYNHYPKWFVEGSAATVENAYVYYNFF